MAYKLIHHFDPEFDHTHLKPKEDSSGRVDHYNLGYVQNVVRDQVVAELVPDNSDDSTDEKYLQQDVTLPVGFNTKINPENTLQLLADANGYVYYLDGLIVVKKVLNVRRDVDFHTGNIIFVNEICVHGSIRTGFTVQGRNILVQGTIEGAHIKASEKIVSECGVKGGKMALLEAGDEIRLPFCENAVLNAQGNILISGASMHNTIWANNNLVIKGRHHGGRIYSNGLVYIEDQLGGGISTTTSIVMGYSPKCLQQEQEIAAKILETQEKCDYLEKMCAKSDIHMQEYHPKLAVCKKALDAMMRTRKKIWSQIAQTSTPERCKLIVPGEVKPGVEISIGGAYLKINDFISNVCFTLRDGEIHIESPAMTKQ